MRRVLFPMVRLVAGIALLAIVLPAHAYSGEVPRLLVPANAAPLSAPVRLPETEQTDAVRQLLEEGQKYELEGRWAAAVAHYEDALRHFPDNASLWRRFELSRLHYDVERRYTDRSYLQMLGQISLAEALQIYEDVLLKIEAHYVEPPHWDELAGQGIHGLQVALSERVFVQWHLSGQPEAAVATFSSQLDDALRGQIVKSRADARRIAAGVAQLAERQLGLQPAATVVEFACAAASGLDPYCAYLTPSQLRDLYSQIEGSFVGLGVELKSTDGALQVVRVIPGSPAKRSGILAGDLVLAVDGRSTSNVSIDQAADLLQGPEGSMTELLVETPGQVPRRVRVVRRRIDVPSIEEARILEPASGVAYLKLTSFQKTTGRDLDLTLWNLHKLGMRSLIIDLRGNPGGLLSMAVEVADRFLDQGVIVTTRGRNIAEDVTYSAHQAGTWHVPLVVLIDGQSASAAEIFAGAIRDHGRGTIVGTTSYGKGSVQGIFPLKASDSGLRLTTSRFYRPSGHPYNHAGVQPDVVVRYVARPAGENGELAEPQEPDPMLAAALQVARQLVAQRLSSAR